MSIVKKGDIKKITALSIATAILTCSLEGCSSNNTNDTLDTLEITENIAENEDPKTADEIVPPPEMPEEPIPAPETYEDYMKLADTYLQVVDVIQALAILDEGIEKLGIDSLSQRKEYILAGTVAIRTKLTENTYDDEGNIFPIFVLECDENGNEIKYVYYDAEGEIETTDEYQYDADGNRTEYKSVYKNKFDESDRSYSDHWTWTYDDNGNVIEYAEYDENGNIGERAEHEYDINGNRIKTTWYDKTGEIKGWAESEYDTAGNEIKYERYNENGSCTRKIIQDYDEYGKQTNYTAYDGEGNITEKEEREYDENGNEVKYVSYSDAATMNCWYETEYDESGNQIKFVCYDDEGDIGYMWEYGYDENGREIYESLSDDYNVIMWEYEYDESGNQIKKILTYVDRETEQKDKTIGEYTYDENGNMTEYDCTYYEGNEAKSLRWERKYDEAGRKTVFYFYDNEKTASYQSETEYDENGLIINYSGYDKYENDFVRRETEYDEFGNVIRESYYDENNDLIQYYENEYDDFGSVTRQAMYEGNVLKYEKQMSYTYRYIGNIDAEAAEYMNKEMTPEEYNLKQREIFTRFLNGQEKICYCYNTASEEYGIQGGKIVKETITDLVDFEYVKQGKYTRNYKRGLEYTFLDMTGDGIEELLIRCGGERLCVIQCSYGTLKVIYDIEPKDCNTYLVKCNGRTGICCAYFVQLGGDWNECCFLDRKGKKEIFLDVYQDEYIESIFYSMSDNDSFEERDISKGEYYDIMSGMVEKVDIDWQNLKKPTP